MNAHPGSKERPLSALVALWLACVAAIAIVRARDPSAFAIHDLASSPAALAAGRLWTLVTSAFIIDGPSVPQIVMTALVAGVVVRLGGAATFALSAVAGHLGATVIAYLGIAAVSIADPATAHGVVHAPDYGISAVWAASTGTLLVLVHRGGAHPRVTAACGVVLLAAFLALVGIDGELADVEHLLAFLIGVGVAAVRSPSGRLTTFRV
jgi:hypothetical protein